MKKFIIHTLIITIVFGTIFNLYSFFRLHLTYKNPNGEHALLLNGSEIFNAIYKSKTKKKVKKVIIGDSVAEQIYSVNEYNDSIYSLSCNQAITLAGHYCLLKSFIETNKEVLPEEVILYYNPFSLKNNLDRFAFHYFLKNFYYNNEYEKDLNEDIINTRVKKIPYYFLAKLPIIKGINWSPSYTLPDENVGQWCSPITKCYLNKIDSLCKDNNLKFKFHPSPVKEDRKKELHNLLVDTDPLLKAYIDNLNYRPANEFTDQIHFKKNYIPQNPLNL